MNKHFISVEGYWHTTHTHSIFVFYCKAWSDHFTHMHHDSFYFYVIIRCQCWPKLSNEIAYVVYSRFVFYYLWGGLNTFTFLCRCDENLSNKLSYCRHCANIDKKVVLKKKHELITLSIFETTRKWMFCKPSIIIPSPMQKLV